MADIQAPPTVGELLNTLARDFGTLVRQEVRLASAEMTAKAHSAGRSVLLVATGGGLGAIGLLALVAAGIAALDLLMPLWLSALLVGFALVVAGYLVARLGLEKLRQIKPLPEQTIATVRDDVAWIKEQAR
jgi:putative superfamily III holin-X